MCNFASAIITKDHVYFGKTDSHEDIIVEHQLHEGAGRVNFVLVEITPPGRDLSADLATWDYHADQQYYSQWGHYYYELPKWYDPVRDEARARTALAASKLLPLILTYDKAMKPAQAAYDKVVKSAQAAYYKAMKPAIPAYDKVVKPALTAYDKATKSTRAAYQKARAAIAAQPW